MKKRPYKRVFKLCEDLNVRIKKITIQKPTNIQDGSSNIWEFSDGSKVYITLL
jgi:hypothetical protein